MKDVKRLVTFLAVVMGCDSAEPFSSARAATYADAVEVQLAKAPVELCGNRPTPIGPATVVALSIEQCLGCEEIGFVLRSLRRDSERRSSALILVAPDSAADLVCTLLRRERLLDNIDVTGIGNLPWVVSPSTDGFLAYQRSSRGVTSARFVRRAIELLSDTVGARRVSP